MQKVGSTRKPPTFLSRQKFHGGDQRQRKGEREREKSLMAEQKGKKEPCKKEACDIQACLSKNNFLPQRCHTVIEKLQLCCDKCEYKSTHCGSLSGLLKQITK